MKSLDISLAEAINLIQYDDLVDQGGDLFKLTEEQEKNSKKSRQMNGVNPYGKKTTRTKKTDNEKQNIIQKIAEALRELGAENIEITNEEREIIFSLNNRKFKITLSAPRN